MIRKQWFQVEVGLEFQKNQVRPRSQTIVTIRANSGKVCCQCLILIILLSCKENKQNTTVKTEEPTENGDMETCQDESSNVKENDKEKTKEQQNGGMLSSLFLLTLLSLIGSMIVQTRVGKLPPICKHQEELKIQGEAEYSLTNFEVFSNQRKSSLRLLFVT